MNRLEARFAEELKALEKSGEVVWWAYEPIRFRLADGTTYTPDFVAVHRDGSIRVTETKGFLRDDSAVKFKVAAEAYPWLWWKMVTWKRGQWQTVYER